MPDLNDQLHGYHDALAATVEPVTAAEAMTTGAPPSPEARDRRARWQWRIAAAAAAVLVIMVGSVAVIGESGPMRWFTGDEADSLRGRTFQAVSLTESGGAPEPAMGSLTFSDDRISLNGGCTGVNAPFALERGRLTVGSGTRRGQSCDIDVEGPERWSQVLASANLTLDGERLTLSDDTITVEFVDQSYPRPPGTSKDDTSTTTVASVARPPTLADLEGRSFRSTSVREDGFEKVLVPSIDEPDVGSPSNLWFRMYDGVLSASGGCNGLSYTPTITDGHLNLTRGTQSLRSCGQALEAQDTWFFAFLESSPEIAIAGSTLKLLGGTTEVVLTEQAPTTRPTTSTPMVTPPTTIETATTDWVNPPDDPVPSPLVGTTWELVRIDRDPTAPGWLDPTIVLPIDVAQTGQASPTLLFVTEATVEMAGIIGGFNGCYRLTGGYSRTGTTLRPSTVSLPLDSCAPAAKAIALALGAALEDQQPPYTFTIDASGLRLESEAWTLQFRSA